MFEQAVYFPSGRDRRSQTSWNRIRRFINNYWVVPLLICYLQFSTQIFYAADPPLERLYKGNRTFFQGIPIFYEIATHEFPHTLIGHLYEIVDYGLYQWDLYQVPHEELRVALELPRARQEIYQRLATSRAHHQSEIGGIVTLSYPPGGPLIHLHEIPSLNEDYSARLREVENSIPQFVDLLSSEGNEEIFEKVGLQRKSIQDLLSLMRDNRISEDVKKTLIQNFVEMYDALSESRYLLSPHQFKEALGKIPLGERFVGLYHFHNGMNEPPSAIDIEQSLRKRQLVITFSQEGWVLYDVVKRDLERINIEVDKKLSLQ